jgi:hypothetical protein
VRAKKQAKKAAPKATTSKAPPAPTTPPPTPPVDVPRLRGRPKNSPDVWTPEHIEEVAQQLWEYIETTLCPTEAEFCYKYLVAHQRLSDIPVLRELKSFMFAKRQAYTIGEGIDLHQGDGPRGAFLAKLAANAGPFSLVDKSEKTIRDSSPGGFKDLSDEDLEKVIADEMARRANG